MADLSGQSLDPNVKATGGGRTVIETGWYKAVILNDRFAPNKAGTGSNLQIRFQVVDGAYMNETIDTWLCIIHPKEKTQAIAQGQLKTLCELTNTPYPPTDTSIMHGKPFALKIVKFVEEYNGNMVDKNEVKGFKDLNALTPQGDPAPQQAQQPQHLWAISGEIMANLAEVIDLYTPAKAIDADYESRRVSRNWLGLSECGNKCMRYLWYAHHGYDRKPIEGRVLRLFQLGNILEDQLIIDLKSAGYTLTDQQKEVTFTWDDLTLKGHIDGIISGLVESSQPHLWECKTASEKKFNELKKLGSYEQWNEVYKAQIHIYMLGLKLKRCLIIVYNKNTSELYTERIKLDKEYAQNTLAEVFMAIEQEHEPERLCPNASWYKRAWCDYGEICFAK